MRRDWGETRTHHSRLVPKLPHPNYSMCVITTQASREKQRHCMFYRDLNADVLSISPLSDSLG